MLFTFFTSLTHIAIILLVSSTHSSVFELDADGWHRIYKRIEVFVPIGADVGFCLFAIVNTELFSKASSRALRDGMDGGEEGDMVLDSSIVDVGIK